MTHYLKRAIVFVGKSEERAFGAICFALWIGNCLTFAGLYLPYRGVPIHETPFVIGALTVISGTFGLAFVVGGAAVIVALAPAAIVRYAKELEGNRK